MYFVSLCLLSPHLFPQSWRRVTHIEGKKQLILPKFLKDSEKTENSSVDLGIRYRLVTFREPSLFLSCNMVLRKSFYNAKKLF